MYISSKTIATLGLALNLSGVIFLGQQFWSKISRIAAKQGEKGTLDTQVAAQLNMLATSCLVKCGFSFLIFGIILQIISIWL